MTEIPTPTGTGEGDDSAWTIVRSRKVKGVSPIVSYSTVKSGPYTRAVKSMTAKSLKRPIPSSPTDHCSASKRKPNLKVTIKQEFIEGLDTAKGLAPIFGSTSRKSSEVRDVLPNVI